MGREAEQTQLDTCLERALRGIRQVIFVTGEAGAGKSTLIDAFQHRAAMRFFARIARGQGIEDFAGKEAYYPLLEAVGQLVRSADASSAIQTLAKHAPTSMIQFPALLSVKQKETLQREVLGTMGERVVRQICEALESMSSANPLLLILEDLHWADPSTIGVISALARRRGSAKLMILATCRTEAIATAQNPLKRLKQDLLVHRLCQECQLPRLTGADVTDYFAAEFPGSRLPAGLAELVHQRSGGNPLFMVTIVQDLVRKGILVERLGQWELTQPLRDIDPGVPQTLQEVLEVQLDQLNAEEQQILKCACILGERFSAWAIASSVGFEPDRIEQLCEDLAERQRFIRSAGIHELADGTVSAQSLVILFAKALVYRNAPAETRVALKYVYSWGAASE